MGRLPVGDRPGSSDPLSAPSQGKWTVTVDGETRSLDIGDCLVQVRMTMVQETSVVFLTRA